VSATSEIILHKIKLLEEKIDAAAKVGNDVSELRSQLESLNKQLSVAVGALNEGKNILKG